MRADVARPLADTAPCGALEGQPRSRAELVRAGLAVWELRRETMPSSSSPRSSASAALPDPARPLRGGRVGEGGGEEWFAASTLGASLRVL